MNKHDEDREQKQEQLNRRRFLAWAGATGAAVGAGVVMGKGPAALAQGGPLDRPASVWPAEFSPNGTDPEYPPRDKPKAGDKVHEFDITVTIDKHEIVPMVETHMFTFNHTYPGPLIRVPEGEWVQVTLINKSPEFHTIHWHGIQLANEMDGVPLGTQWPVGPNESFRYLWRAQPSGTHFYHCHVMTTLHQQAGLVGALVIEAKDDIVQKFFPYTRDYTLLLSELDTNFVRDMMNEMVVMGNQMEAMNHSARMMREMSGQMMGWFKDKQSFLAAIKKGYIPPYTQPMNGLTRPITPQYFMINGKSYPMTDPVMIRSGENIRVRLIGGGMQPHYMHLHGHDFWHVCQDGAPLAVPIRMNTIPVFPGTTSDIVIQGTNPGNWHFHDHSDLATTNNGQHPGGMMTMLMYEDAKEFGVDFPDTIAISS
ncbi:MAG: multicopper oxidase domain-containing protein [Chloroflexi bacterium]|nr:multicopper oxidase domain-containing protein [Chloroflexota bacterium]